MCYIYHYNITVYIPLYSVFYDNIIVILHILEYHPTIASKLPTCVYI